MSFFDDNGAYPNDTTYTPGVYNGASRTAQAPYNASFKKTAYKMEADPSGVQNPGFADGHVKSVHVAQLTHAGNLWSINGNDQWP